MFVVNPSVTWPNHTSMVTGVAPAKHGVLFNGLPTFPQPNGPVVIEPWRDKQELVLAPTVYDLAHAAGVTTAQVNWVAIQNAPTITWEFPERPRVDGRIEREMTRLGLIDASAIQDFSRAVPVWRDQKWTEADAYILRTYRPGLMLFHLLNVDAVNHRCGEGTWASHSGYAYADRCVQDLLQALRDGGIADKTTILVVSDHGFMNLRKTIRPNALLASIGLLKGSGKKIVCDAFVVPEGGLAMLFVRNRAKRSELRERLTEAFERLEGIARGVQPGEAMQLGMPHPDQSERMADLVLAAMPGYGFSGDTLRSDRRGHRRHNGHTRFSE